MTVNIEKKGVLAFIEKLSNFHYPLRIRQKVQAEHPELKADNEVQVFCTDLEKEIARSAV